MARIKLVSFFDSLLIEEDCMSPIRPIPARAMSAKSGVF